MKSLRSKVCSMFIASTILCSAISPGLVSASAVADKTEISGSEQIEINSELYKERLQKIIDNFDAEWEKRHSAARDYVENYSNSPAKPPETPKGSSNPAPEKVPAPSLNEGRYTFDWQGTPLNKSLYAVAKLAKKNVVVNGDLKGEVYTSLTNVTCAEALNYLGQSFNFNWRIHGNTIVVCTSDKFLQSTEIPIKYANKEMLVEEMKALGIEAQNVYANQETGTVSVTGTAYQISEAVRRIKALDHPVPQVLVLAQMIEVNHGDTLNLGMQYTLPTFTHKGTDDSTSRNLPGNVWEKMTFGAIANANKELAKGRVIARPMVMMLNGQEGLVNFGDQVPVLSSTATTSSTTVTVDYKDVGSKLKIKPVINEALNEVTLNINVEVSSIGKWRTLGTTQAPQINTRSAVTSAHIKSGQSVVIGGLLSMTELDNLSGIPGLMDLPILGKLFRFHSKSKTYGEVFIQITPYIVSNDLDVKSIAHQIGE